MNRLEEYFIACLEASYQTVEGGVDFAVERNGDVLFLFFEQSRGAEDWMKNLQFQAVPYREMHPMWKCHAGFLQAWKCVLPHIEAVMQEPGIRRVTLIGYSHGAAIALLCHEWIWYHFPHLRKNLCGFGFGCPRVLYGCLPPRIAKRWRSFFIIRNGRDAVTHLPPAVMGYCHTGSLIEIGQGSERGAVDDHRPRSYLEALHELSKASE